MFCEKCKSLVLPKEGVLICTRCGHETKAGKDSSLVMVEKGKKKTDVLILDEEKDVAVLPRTRAECSECGNMEAYWWMIQTRRADEPETRFLRCTKCKFTWREYD